MSKNSEIGRELKASELQPRKVVIVSKWPHSVMLTLWVVSVRPTLVHFLAGEIHLEFFAIRTGPNGDSLIDDSGQEMKVFEYLGKV